MKSTFFFLVWEAHRKFHRNKTYNSNRLRPTLRCWLRGSHHLLFLSLLLRTSQPSTSRSAHADLEGWVTDMPIMGNWVPVGWHFTNGNCRVMEFSTVLQKPALQCGSISQSFGRKSTGQTKEAAKKSDFMEKHGHHMASSFALPSIFLILTALDLNFPFNHRTLILFPSLLSLGLTLV